MKILLKRLFGIQRPFFITISFLMAHSHDSRERDEEICALRSHLTLACISGTQFLGSCHNFSFLNEVQKQFHSALTKRQDTF